MARIIPGWLDLTAKPYSAPSGNPQGARFREFYALLLIIMAVALVFLPVTGFEFQNFDDNINVYDNALVCDFSWASFWRFWSGPYAGLYIPMTYSVWEFLAGLSAVFTNGPTMPPNPAFFHTANLLIHLTSVLIFFRILRQLLNDLWPAVVGALLFGLHPVQVEAVAWVTGMKDLLGGFFSLLALRFYLLYAAAPVGTRKYSFLRHYGLASLFFILALLAKPSTVTVPLLIWVVGYFCLSRPPRLLTRDLLPWLLLVIPVVLITSSAQPTETQVSDFSFWQRILVAGDAISFYLYKLLWPITFAPDYGHNPARVVAQGWAYLTLLPPLGMLGLCFWKRSSPYLRAGVLLFIIALAPVLGLVPFNFQKISTVADRYFYLSMLGPGLLAAWLFSRFRHRTTTVVMFTLLALLGIGCRLALRPWHDSFAFNRHALQVNPRSSIAYNNLGVAYSDAGNFEEALNAYLRAIEITPGKPDAYFNLGGLYNRSGNPWKSIDYYRQALARDPHNFGLVYRKIGDAFEMLGDHEQALSNYKLALYHFRLDEAGGYELARVHVAIGLLFKKTGRNDAATEAYHQALLVKPDFAEALSNLGVIYEEQGRVAEAEELYRQAVARKPTLAEPYNNLGLIFLGRHQEQEAIALFRKAVELSPFQPVPLNNLGKAYLALNQYDAALSAFQQALKINPGFAPAMSGLATVHRRMGREDLAGPYAARAKALGYNDSQSASSRELSEGIKQP